jgi:pimeloyl-ACP methyl ester carboxylesterase
MIMNARESQTLILEDGRKLGFAEYGTANGDPIFYFSGGNSSRIEGRWFDQEAKNAGVRLVVPDRPGFGLSTFQPNRQFLDWPDDVEQLASSLGVDRYAVFGLSGGAPHVAAVAYRNPDKLTGAAIISGVAPPEMPNRLSGMWPPIRLIFFSAKSASWLNRKILAQMGSFYANEDRMRQQMVRALPEPDVELISRRPEIIEIFSEAAQEAHRNGIDGDAWEWRLYVHPWGFKLSEIPIEIGLWYGKYDQNAPAAMGEFYSKKLPLNRFKIVEDGGHFSTINNHIGEVFNYLLQVV